MGLEGERQEVCLAGGGGQGLCLKERGGAGGGGGQDPVEPLIPIPIFIRIWNLVYLSTLAAGEHTKKFAHYVIPPRDWCLDRTNALANRLAGLDNVCKRLEV